MFTKIRSFWREDQKEIKYKCIDCQVFFNRHYVDYDNRAIYYCPKCETKLQVIGGE